MLANVIGSVTATSASAGAFLFWLVMGTWVQLLLLRQQHVLVLREQVDNMRLLLPVPSITLIP